MLKTVIVSVLMLFSIFWGLFPASENSPHNKIAGFFGYEEEIHYSIYILIGSIFYITSAFLAHQESINYMWK
jgi:hypothetical protein|tara:strand:+ start:374 stop:589 length:216 start_codon:yes stop_codon:yes gene_type:complete